MIEATVGHLLQENGHGPEILLGKRQSKRNFQNGKWNGGGGRRDRPETILRCLERELMEEFGVQIDQETVRHYTSVDYHHPDLVGHNLEWRVHFFSIKKWLGEPKPLDGFTEVKWFPIKDLPFDDMMSCQRVWLPAALNNPHASKIFKAEIFYGDPEMKAVERGTFRFVKRYSLARGT